MNILKILSILLTASYPVILLFIYLHRKDKNKEPKKILIMLFIGGMLSIIVTFLLSIVAFVAIPFYGMKDSELTKMEIIIQYFIGVALVEEYSKWIFVHKIGYKSDEFDEPYDMLLYSGIVALGFAVVENLMYVFEGGLSTGFIRSITAVPGHVCYGIFMGYYLYLAKIADQKSNNIEMIKYKFLSIFVPVMIHGLYDVCLTQKFSLLLIVFPILLIVLYIITIKKVKLIAKEKTKIKN